MPAFLKRRGIFYEVAKQADKPDSVHAQRPKTRRAWQPFL